MDLIFKDGIATHKNAKIYDKKIFYKRINMTYNKQYPYSVSIRKNNKWQTKECQNIQEVKNYLNGV